MNNTAKKERSSFRAVASKVRQDALQFLVESSAKVSVQVILRALKIDPTLLSHHLRVLRDEKIIECRRNGKNVEYWLSKNCRIKGKDKFNGFQTDDYKLVFK